ncbi:Capsular exopolysaccharide biosynthesis protein [Hyella patelloides LEGE 07179]|uniref:non-specific protein-tyrosine kinase n=1 Tax=Hyella patelloides LEGE 07179 TaxID=945734 RepID=A0A563VLD6_9CYAN|nr:polysaccharide biosynthesis tyrosine autokinase [Hyella patelloides]VEP12231.1 Capsular exopolysaccharide biosynthesis protein [Hyella patelloides LEGE 07179]
MNNPINNPEFVQLPSQETGFSLSELKQIIFRRWKPALIVGTTVFAGIFIPTMLQTPKYQSETFILLENPQTKESARIVPGNMTRGSAFSSLRDLSTEILVLRSNSLISQAIAQYPNTFKGLSVGEVISKLSINTQEVNEIPTDVLTVSFIDSSPQRAKEVLDALGKVYVQYSLDKQRSQAANAIDFIDEQLPDSQLDLDKVAYDIRSFRQENNLVDPNIYASDVSKFRQSLEQDSRSTEIALARAKSKYQELYFQLQQLGQEPDTILASTVLSQDGVYRKLATQLSGLETQYLLNSTNFKDTFPIMQDLKDKGQELQELLRERATQVLGNTVSQAVLDKAIATSAEIINNTNTTTSITNATESESTTENSEVNSQGNILASLGNQLLAAKHEIAILESQIGGTDKAKAKVENSFQDVPQLQEAYAELERQLVVKSESLDYLLKRRQELQISLAQETAPWKVLDKPYLPHKPISPNIQRGLALALAGGGFIGILTAWLLHQLDTRVKLIDEVKQITQLPLLGAVPKVLEPRIVLSNEAEINISKGYNYSYSSFTEAFRAIAMNLGYMMAQSGKIKSLVLTSSTSSEGKSTTAYNLGLALTDLGSRVLIVDADMRKPKMHKLTKQSNEKGLTEAIVSDEHWSEIVNPNIVDGLDVMTAGSNVPNPIAILNSPKMAQLLKEWEESYDYVLIDTPPIGIMADAQSIIHLVDTVLFVVGIERATQKSISHTLEILQGNHSNLAGFVANFVEKDLDYYSYSYYSHYYNQPTNSGNENQQENSGIMQQFRRR